MDTKIPLTNFPTPIRSSLFCQSTVPLRGLNVKPNPVLKANEIDEDRRGEPPEKRKAVQFLPEGGFVDILEDDYRVEGGSGEGGFRFEQLAV